MAPSGRNTKKSNGYEFMHHQRFLDASTTSAYVQYWASVSILKTYFIIKLSELKVVTENTKIVQKRFYV